MSDKTPFQEWWEEIGKDSFWHQPQGNEWTARKTAHLAWLAALEHARELMREEETE